jgi:two-component system sensor histidine kinase KdpD
MSPDIDAHTLASLRPPTVQIRVMIPAATPLTVADPALLERVLANLLSNAIRYSPADFPATVTASAPGDGGELRVIDQGPGVSPTDRDRIFAPFCRQGGQSAPPGAGLSLALSRGLTEAMQGTLTPEDNPGGGLTMTCRCPQRTQHPHGRIRLRRSRPGAAFLNACRDRSWPRHASRTSCASCGTG